MDGLVRGFVGAAAVYGLLGILVGLHMAMGHDHTQVATHAHVNLIGWVSFFVFGLFYKFMARGVPRWLALVHFWLAQLSMPAMFAGLWLFKSGREEFEPLAAISSLAYAVSFAVFVVIVFISLRHRENASTA
jgi:cbb3-type cytochrome oxidase subunit 1